MTTSQDKVSKSPHVQQSLFAVAAGGAVGTLIRVIILNETDSRSSGTSARTVPFTHFNGFVPWGLLAVNTVGVLLATWLLCGPLRGRSVEDRWRLFTITGLLGGLTSYSGLIRDLALIRTHSVLEAASVLVLSLTLGLSAAILGAKLARR